MRKGVSLIEVLVALAIVAGPMIAVVGMFRGQARDAHALAESERMAMVLDDAMNLLATGTPALLSRFAGPAGQPRLHALLASLGADDAPGSRWAATVSLARPPHGVARLARLRLEATSEAGVRLKLDRLIRVDAAQ